MKLIIFVIPVALMIAVIASPVAAQSNQGSPDVSSLINNAYANYQSNPESAVNMYLIPDMGDSSSIAPWGGIFPSENPPTPFLAFNERYQLPDVFAAYNYQIPIPMTFLGSTDNVRGWISTT